MYVNKIADLFLLNNLSSIEYRLVSTLKHLANDRNNSLNPISDKTSLRSLEKILSIGGDGLSRSVIRNAFNKLKDIGVIKSVDGIFILNPNVCFRSNKIPAHLDLLFSNTKLNIACKTGDFKKHNIYIIKSTGVSGEEIIKIGYSSDIEKRLNDYFYHNPSTIILKTMYKEDGIVLEKKLHNTFISSYYNEWYPFSMYQKILDFLEKND